MIYKQPSPQAGYVRVTFEMPASVWANQVYLVGDFNHWEPYASPFRRTHNGVWRITMDLPARQRYEFRYLIDGHWCTDYHADGCAENQSHTLNSVVETNLPIKTFATETSPSMVHETALTSGISSRSLREFTPYRLRTN